MVGDSNRRVAVTNLVTLVNEYKHIVPSSRILYALWRFIQAFQEYVGEMNDFYYDKPLLLYPIHVGDEDALT